MSIAHREGHEIPQSTRTRCETWLQAAFHYIKHFRQINTLILQFNPKEPAAINKVRQN